jgi:hypothetical protein
MQTAAVVKITPANTFLLIFSLLIYLVSLYPSYYIKSFYPSSRFERQCRALRQTILLPVEAFKLQKQGCICLTVYQYYSVAVAVFGSEGGGGGGLFFLQPDTISTDARVITSADRTKAHFFVQFFIFNPFHFVPLSNRFILLFLLPYLPWPS